MDGEHWMKKYILVKEEVNALKILKEEIGLCKKKYDFFNSRYICSKDASFEKIIELIRRKT